MIETAKKIIKLLNQSGYEAYMVGGFVRDYLLNIGYNDIDIATSATPDIVTKMFKSKAVGAKFGTVLVFMDDYSFEVTTFRSEGIYLDSRHPSSVNFEKSLIKDLERRDFTINAIAMDENLKIYDYFNSINDLNNKIIKAVGNPNLRFNEDSLRIIRAFHFVSKLGFDIDKKTLDSMLILQNKLINVSIERIQAELIKIFNGNYCYKAICLMKKFNVFKDYYKLNFDYESNNLLDLYIISFYLNNKTIPSIYHLSKNEIKIINDSFDLIDLNEYDKYMHYIYKDTYERAVKAHSLLFNKIEIKAPSFKINCLRDLKINAFNLKLLGIENKYFSIILRNLEKMVVNDELENERNLLENYAKIIYNNIKGV